MALSYPGYGDRLYGAVLHDLDRFYLIIVEWFALLEMYGTPEDGLNGLNTRVGCPLIARQRARLREMNISCPKCGENQQLQLIDIGGIDIADFRCRRCGTWFDVPQQWV